MLKKSRGQPVKKPIITNDAMRAYLLSVLSEILRKEAGLEPDEPLGLTTKQLLKEAQRRYPININPKYKILNKPTYHEKMLASLKRGREILGLNEEYIRTNDDALGEYLFNKNKKVDS